MPDSLEERVSFLEGRVSDQSDVLKEIRQSLAYLDQKIDRFRDELAGHINALDEQLSGRIAATDERVTALDKKVDDRFNSLESKLNDRFKSLDSKLDRVSTRVETRMVWLFGVQVTILLAVVGALLRVVG